jgi:hypothetical protein
MYIGICGLGVLSRTHPSKQQQRLGVARINSPAMTTCDRIILAEVYPAKLFHFALLNVSLPASDKGNGA